jgi:DNA-binding transcriptional LysR family regulator
MQNKLFLIGNNERKFKLKSYDKSIFDEIQLIYREQGSGTRLVMERFIEKNNLTVHKKMELTSNEAVKQAVIAGIGYSIMPLIGLKNELIQKELQIIPFKNFPIKSNWNLIWMKNKNHSPVANAFLNHIKKEKNNIINEHFNWCDNY